MYSIANGQIIPIENVSDPTFAQDMIGKGVAILPATVIELSCVLQTLMERRLAVSLYFLNPLLNLVMDIHQMYLNYFILYSFYA